MADLTSSTFELVVRLLTQLSLRGSIKENVMKVEGSDRGATIINQGIYEISATQRHRLGTRLVRGDRVYKYAKAGCTLATQILAWYNDYGVSSYAAVPTASAYGQPTLYATIGATDGVAADGVVAAHELQGAWVTVFNLNAGAASTDFTFQILDNNAVASGGGTVTLTLDSDLPYAATTSAATEITGNIYSDVRTGNSGGHRGMVGVAMGAATTTLPYFWLQTWGPTWVAPQAAVGATAMVNQVVARHDGSLDTCGLVADDAYGNQLCQHVGFVITRVAGGAETQGTPLIMLQISV